ALQRFTKQANASSTPLGRLLRRAQKTACKRGECGLRMAFKNSIRKLSSKLANRIDGQNKIEALLRHASRTHVEEAAHSLFPSRDAMLTKRGSELLQCWRRKYGACAPAPLACCLVHIAIAGKPLLGVRSFPAFQEADRDVDDQKASAM